MLKNIRMYSAGRTVHALLAGRYWKMVPGDVLFQYLPSLRLRLITCAAEFFSLAMHCHRHIAVIAGAIVCWYYVKKLFFGHANTGKQQKTLPKKTLHMKFLLFVMKKVVLVPQPVAPEAELSNHAQ